MFNEFADIATGVDATTVKVLSSVVGRDDECTNDVIACYGGRVRQHVIFFPGDVQDYENKMKKHRDNHAWKEYNLEDTARLIYARFDCACVWVIKASKLHLNTFACYKNFVQSNMFGVPNYSTSEITALSQTSSLLNKCIRTEFKECIQKDIAEKPVSIIGFSKGCMVLNQMLHEWNLMCSTNQNSLQHFTQQIKHLYWLDSGNCGDSGAWVTDESYLKEVVKSVEFHVHVTPYQISDKFRPWIGEEHGTFIKHLKNQNSKLKEFVHFEDEERSLRNHFKLLLTFQNVLQTNDV